MWLPPLKASLSLMRTTSKLKPNIKTADGLCRRRFSYYLMLSFYVMLSKVPLLPDSWH